MERGSRWFQRIKKDIKKISRFFRVVRIKYGFYRIYYKNMYVHEIYKEMPQFGHDIYDKDMRFQSKKYYEEYEDRGEITRKLKNYVEGYWDSLDRIRTRAYMFRNDKEFNKTAEAGSKNFAIK